jgi:hypothetical protein
METDPDHARRSGDRASRIHEERRPRTMPKLPNASDLVTLEEAADYAGYRSVSTLRKAAREGHLRVVQLSPRTILTTHAWVSTYEDYIYGKGGRPRGAVMPPRVSAATDDTSSSPSNPLNALGRR